MPWWSLFKGTKHSREALPHARPAAPVVDARAAQARPGGLDPSDVDYVVELFQSVLPRRTKDEAVASLSRHGWNLQSALQHIDGAEGLAQSIRDLNVLKRAGLLTQGEFSAELARMQQESADASAADVLQKAAQGSADEAAAAQRLHAPAEQHDAAAVIAEEEQAKEPAEADSTEQGPATEVEEAAGRAAADENGPAAEIEVPASAAEVVDDGVPAAAEAPGGGACGPAAPHSSENTWISILKDFDLDDDAEELAKNGIKKERDVRYLDDDLIVQCSLTPVSTRKLKRLFVLLVRPSIWGGSGGHGGGNRTRGRK